MTEPPASPAARLCVLGAAGAALMAAASWWVGAVPIRFERERPGPLGWFPHHGAVPFAASYLGLATLSLAWLALGRRVLARDPAASPALLRRFAAVTAAPFLLAAPFGRDLWAYAAQGNLVRHGVDAYQRGPAAVPGAFTAEVSGRWLHSPSPYGPLWLRVSQLADWISGGHPTGAALLLRLPGYAGLLLCLGAVTVLARRMPGRSTPAVWVGLANPLTITLGIGGGHNDLIMMGLAFGGLALATRPGLRALAAGAALAGAAVMVKSPAAVVVAFTVPVWLAANHAAPALRRVIAACLTALAAAAAAVAALTAACGLGTGWTRQVNSDSSWVSWLSLPSGVGMLTHAATGTPLKAVDDTMRTIRSAGEVIAVIALIALWLLAVRRSARSVSVPLGLLAVALAVAALLAPSVQPWYYCWGLALAGLVVTRHTGLVLLATVGLVFAVMITPDGFGLESGPWAVAVIAGGLLACWLALRLPGSAAHHDGADHTRPEVRAEDGAELGHA